jgi:type III secretion protein V
LFSMEALNRYLVMAAQRQDMVFAVFFVMIVAMLIMPVPTVLIDTLLAVNLTLSLIVLITATYLKHSLEISTFPAIILVTTVFRVALSVATTRAILAYGDAGHLITAFGNFVIAGNIVVGLVVFMIIAIVQFMVVTKGAERISEVSARFTLDAMPGKQMSIDNDLRSGDITKEQAKSRRSTLERESQFHGAMDGAMRFVKGDAIASLIIVFVNLLGGLTIGMAQRGLSFGEAGRLYTLLSVGDGLIAQIPAMFIALAAGIIVTRVASDDSSDLGRDISRQLGAEPKALGVSGAVAVAMGFIPGFPTTVFFILGSLLLFVAWKMTRAAKRAKEALEGPSPSSAAQKQPLAQPESEQPTQPPTPPPPPEYPPLRPSEAGDSFAISGHPDFLDMLRPDAVYRFLDYYRTLFMSTMGFQLMPSGFKFDPKMAIGEFMVEIDGVPVSRHQIDNVAPPRPLTNEQAEQYAKAIFEVRRRHAAQLFGVPEAGRWLEDIQPSVGRLANDVQQLVPFLTLVDALRSLLEDGVGLNPPRLVLEGLIQASQRSQEPEAMAEIVRSYLRRQICFGVADPERVINALVVGPDIDAALRKYAGGDQDPAGVASNDQMIREFVEGTKLQIAEIEVQDPDKTMTPVIISTADTRRMARKVLWQNGVETRVLSYSDIAPEFQVRTLAVLTAEGRVDA